MENTVPNIPVSVPYCLSLGLIDIDFGSEKYTIILLYIWPYIPSTINHR